MTESFKELFTKSLVNAVPGEIIQASVVSITTKHVIVDAQCTKSEAVIPLEQFKDQDGELEVKVVIQ